MESAFQTYVKGGKLEKDRYYEMGIETLDLQEMVVIDKTFANAIRRPKITVIERCTENNKAKFMDGGKKKRSGNEEFILDLNQKIAFGGDNFAWLAN